MPSHLEVISWDRSLGSSQQKVTADWELPWELPKYEQGKLKALFHKLKTDIVFCHARFVGAAWRRHINTTLGAGHNVGQELDADDLRFLKEAGHVDWHQLAV